MNKRELLEKWNSKLRQYEDVANNETVPKVLRSDARRQTGAILRFLQDIEKLNEGILESRKALIDLFAPRLEKIFEDQYPTKAQIYDALHKSISDLERT